MMQGMQRKHRLACILIPIVGALSTGAAWAAKPQPAAAAVQPASPSREFVDGIAAIVNKNVITLRQLETETQTAEGQLKLQKIPVPDRATLRKQVLQRMINDELERQEAERLNIKVGDEQVQQAVQTIAQRNRISPERLKQEIEKSGVAWSDYLNSLRQEVRQDMLRQRAVDSSIVITDADIDAFLKNEGNRAFAAAPAPAAQAPAQPAPQKASGPAILGLAQILVAVPENSSRAQVEELRRKAEAILAKLRGGADFAGVAAASSDGPQALNGGELGVRPVEGWPDLFVQATESLQPGQVSGIIQSGNGFHILKVLTRGQPARGGQAPVPAASPAQAPQAAQSQGPMMVTQTHARHILIKTSKVVSNAQAEERVRQLRERIEHGESFEALAKRYSQDASAPQGGDLGWLTPGETVPAFEQAMDALQPGQVSQPVQSHFGWHLIQVLERRTKNMETEYRRMQARQILFQRRAEPAFEDWLNQLRGQAYIDNRLDPSANRGKR